VHPDCVAAVGATAALLEALGHDVTASGPAALDDDLDGAQFRYFAVVIGRELDRWSAKVGEPITEADVEGRNWGFYELGAAVTARQFVADTEALQGWHRRLASWWAPDGAFDLLLTPTFETPPPLLTHRPTIDEPRGRFTMPFDFTGQPAVSLPLHWSDDGLPIGIQLVAPSWREDVLLRVAAQLEAAQPWANRRPPLSA